MQSEDHGIKSWRDLFGTKKTNVVLQAGPTAGDNQFKEADLSVDARYKPTEEGLKFLEINNIHVAYEHLKERYKTVKANEERWENERTAEKGFRNTGYEYDMELQRYTNILAARLSKQARLTREGSLLLNRLVNFNKISKTQTKDDLRANQIRNIMSMEVLVSAAEIALFNQSDINLKADMDSDEKDYWARRPE